MRKKTRLQFELAYRAHHHHLRRYQNARQIVLFDRPKENEMRLASWAACQVVAEKAEKEAGEFLRKEGDLWLRPSQRLKNLIKTLGENKFLIVEQ